jgi:hypothetical protein
MRLALQRWLDSPRTITFASLVTLAIGLFFVFVWAPHPWSWRGIDQYDELARALARGEPFGTTDVPWGYAYFVAAFYRLFPNTPWAAVTAQVFINALVPWLLYRLARPAVGHRIAALAAWIVAIFSFNTIYASTQTSDSICTVLFLLGLLCFVHAHKTSNTWAFAAAGVLAGLMPQFRPNMILLPVLAIGGYMFYPRQSGRPSVALDDRGGAVSPDLTGARASGARRATQCAVFMVAMVAMLMPWIIRNYRYTGMIQPTSTHSGIQLWYGTLQVGPYLESRAHNPRFYFASAAFDYTSLESSIFVSAETPCVVDSGNLRLAYRTSRDPQLRWIEGRPAARFRRVFEIPAQESPSTIYYFFRDGDNTYPAAGDGDPLVYFVSSDHLGDLDQQHELLDIFDVYRVMRYVAWHEPLPASDKLDLTRDGRVDSDDLSAIVAALLPRAPHPFASFDAADAEAVLRFSDGSSLTMPRAFNGRQTGVDLQGELAGTLISKHRRFLDVHAKVQPGRCQAADEVRINDVFYRKEPHEMRRYTALAFDNISRDPVAFATASAYRFVRLFIVRSGTGDQQTTFQFRGSRIIFNVGLLLSLTYFALFVAGVVIAWRARSPFLYALIPIVYLPMTICFVLTNMRYTITVQPLMFVFVAMTVAAMFRLGAPAAGGGGSSLAGIDG